MTRDISNFISWFIQQFINIGTQVINILDNIVIYGGVTLLDFIIAITILGMFLSIILAIPQNAMHKVERIGRERKKKKENDKEWRTKSRIWTI